MVFDESQSRTSATEQQKPSDYTASALFEDWSDSFSAYEIYVHEDGREDLRILAANRTFANLISADYETLSGSLFTDTCQAGMDWLPFYIETAKTGVGNLHESYNPYLNKYLSALVFSPKIGQVAILVIDRTHLWQADQALRAKHNDLTAIFASMTAGFCVAKVLRDEQGQANDILFELVNASFEILEGFPTATLQGKRMSEVRDINDTYFMQYVNVVDRKSKITFTKHVALNDLTLEVICFSQTDDVFVCIENDITERVKAEAALKTAYATIEAQNQTILSSIDYASKIQKNLLPRADVFATTFADYSIIWKPRDIVGGDIYWMKAFDEGAVLCVCDCTGHGTPGALLTMLVVSAMETTVNEHNYQDTAEIMYQLDKRLVSVLNVRQPSDAVGSSTLDFNDGCDLAILYVAKDGAVTASAANTHLFVCDGTTVTQHKGQRLSIGEGSLTSKAQVKCVTIAADPQQKFYIASDGLYDQIGGDTAHDKAPRPFGYKPFKQLILDHHAQPQAAISDAVWRAFETYRGQQARRDDVLFITFKP